MDTAHKVRSGVTTWQDGETSVEAAAAEIRIDWEAYTSTFLTVEAQQLVEQAERQMAKADEAVQQLSRILKARDEAALDRFVQTDLYPAIDRVSTPVRRLVDLQIRVAEEGYAAGNAAYRTSVIVSGIIGLVALTILGFACLTIARRVVRPLNAMTDAMGKLARGDTSIEVPARGQVDEIGATATVRFRCSRTTRSSSDVSRPSSKPNRRPRSGAALRSIR